MNKRDEEVKKRLKGPVVALNICFNADGSINYSAVRAYVNWLCEQNLPIILLTYGSSEFMSMTEAEIWKLTAETASAIRGRALLIASTGWWKPEKCGEFLRHADQSGVDAVKVQIHPFIPKTLENYGAFFDSIQRHSDIPLLLWGHSTPPLPVDVVVELARRPGIIGMKNDGDPFYDYYDLIRRTRDTGFAVVSGGQMRNFVFGFQIGSPAYLCPIAPFRPDIALHFHELLLNRSYDDAWQMVFRYEEEWMRIAVKFDWMGAIKEALRIYGLYPNNRLCPPLAPLAPDKCETVRMTLEKVFGPIEKISL